MSHRTTRQNKQQVRIASSNSIRKAKLAHFKGSSKKRKQCSIMLINSNHQNIATAVRLQTTRQTPRKAQAVIAVVFIQLLLLVIDTKAITTADQRLAPPFRHCLTPGVDLQIAYASGADGSNIDFSRFTEDSIVFESGSGRSRGPSNKSGASQRRFSTICNGWRSSKGGHTMWVFDQQRSALVAKFIFKNIEDTFDLHRSMALLRSPKFPPIPAYHSIEANRRLFESCQVSFSAYINLKFQSSLDLTLITNDFEGKNEEITLQSLKSNKDKQNPRQTNESLVWKYFRTKLPTLQGKHHSFELQFDLSLLVDKTSPDSRILDGVAINNISLSDECFPSLVNQSELDLLRSLGYEDPIGYRLEDYYFDGAADLTGYERAVVFVRKYFVILALVSLVYVALSLFTAVHICVHNKQQSKLQHHQRHFRQPTWLNLCCTCLCLLYWMYYLYEKVSSNRTNRRRVYVTNHNNSDNSDKNNQTSQDERWLREKDFHLMQYLRPITANGIFDNVELNENPNYAINGRISSFGNAGNNSPCALLDKYHINRDRITFSNKLGRGAFGEVYQACLYCHCSSDDQNEADNDDFMRANRLAVNAGELDHLDSHSKQVAVKTLAEGRESNESQKNFLNEAINMSLVNHRNIVQLIGVCFDKNPFFIVMELCAGGNLKNFLIRNRDKGFNHPPLLHRPSLNATQPQSLLGNHYSNQILAEPNNNNSSSIWSLANNQTSTFSEQPARVRLCMGDLLVIALDIARACDYLQKRQFIHRDLAARNCLLTSCFKAPFLTNNNSNSNGNGPGSTPNSARNSKASLGAKGSCFVNAPPSAIDVDASHRVDINQVFLNGYMDSSIVAKLADFGMTREIYASNYYRTGHKEMPVRWMPPECLDGVATTKSDVWSFGVFLWELFSMGQLPYYNLLDNDKVIDFIRSRRYVRSPSKQQIEQQQQQKQFQQQQQPDLLVSISNETTSYANQNVALPRVISATKDSSHLDDGLDDLDDDEDPLPATTNSANPLIQFQTESGSEIGTVPARNNRGSSSIKQLIEVGDVNEAADLPPLPMPHENTPYSIYAIMVACWATNPEDRPQFEDIANRIYCCLQMRDVLETSLPCFYEQQTPINLSNSKRDFTPTNNNNTNTGSNRSKTRASDASNVI